jgi:hypothetical protein
MGVTAFCVLGIMLYRIAMKKEKSFLDEDGTHLIDVHDL